MSTMTLSGARKNATLIILLANVRSIMPKSVSVPVTTIISNAMQRLGVSKTDIIRQPALFLIMLTSLVPASEPCIKDVKETTSVPAGIPIILTLVRQVRSLKRTQAAALMIHLTGLAAGLPAARRIRL